MNLRRAFQVAGARTVAASLWPVADASTAELMIRFYGHLLDDVPKVEALRAAQGARERVHPSRPGPALHVHQKLYFSDLVLAQAFKVVEIHPAL